jgi:hypothetical protein
MMQSRAAKLSWATLVLGIFLAPRPVSAAPIPISGVTLVSWTDTTLNVIKDGTSNTIVFGENTLVSGCVRNVAPVSIPDGTSNTIVFGELTSICWEDREGLPLTRGNVPSITDGTSNTILIGENTNPYLFNQGSTVDICLSNTSIVDGTSNTISIPENNEPLCLQGVVGRQDPAVAVPEPGSMLMLLGAVGTALVHRRWTLAR